MKLWSSFQTHSSVTLRGSPLGRACRCLLLQRTTVSIQVHWLGHWGSRAQLLTASTEPEHTDRRVEFHFGLILVSLNNFKLVLSMCIIPSSQRKSGTATSCSGISRRKAGPLQRGLPVTIRRLLSHAPNQDKRQSQLKGLARRFLMNSKDGQ